FLAVAEDVVTNDPLVDVDRSIYLSLQGLRTRWGDDVMVTVTQLGSAYVMIPLVWMLKVALARARPPTAYAAIDEYSFPSGHAALGMVVFGFLAFLLGHGKP